VEDKFFHNFWKSLFPVAIGEEMTSFARNPQTPNQAPGGEWVGWGRMNAGASLSERPAQKIIKFGISGTAYAGGRVCFHCPLAEGFRALLQNGTTVICRGAGQSARKNFLTPDSSESMTGKRQPGGDRFSEVLMCN